MKLENILKFILITHFLFKWDKHKFHKTFRLEENFVFPSKYKGKKGIFGGAVKYCQILLTELFCIIYFLRADMSIGWYC